MTEVTRTCYTCHIRDTCTFCAAISTALLKYNAWYDAKRTRIATREIYSGLGRMCIYWKVDPLAGLLPVEPVTTETGKAEVHAEAQSGPEGSGG